MNKAEFLRVLEENLSKLPIEERQSAIGYYEEYLDEAGIVAIGVGCVLLGIGILISILVYVVVGKGIPAIIKGITKLCHRAKGRKQVC